MMAILEFAFGLAGPLICRLVGHSVGEWWDGIVAVQLLNEPVRCPVRCKRCHRVISGVWVEILPAAEEQPAGEGGKD